MLELAGNKGLFYLVVDHDCRRTAAAWHLESLTAEDVTTASRERLYAMENVRKRNPTPGVCSRIDGPAAQAQREEDLDDFT